MIDELNDGVVLIKPNKIITYYNKPVQEIFGVKQIQEDQYLDE